MNFSHSAAAERIAADTVAARDAPSTPAAFAPLPTAAPPSSSGSADLSWFSSALTAHLVTGDASLRLVHDDSGGGRGLVLGNSSKPGSILLSESAFLASLNTDQLDSRCSACWHPLDHATGAGGGGGGGAKRCSACQVARYCSTTCQSAHWQRSHKLECLCLRNYKGRAPATHPAHLPSVWFISQLVLWSFQRPLYQFRTAQIDPGTRSTPTWQAQEKARLESLEKSLVEWDEWLRRWNHTEGNVEQHEPERRQKYAEAATAVREVTMHVCQNQSERELHARLFSIDWFVSAFARLACNGFTLCDSDLRPIGVSLYPSVSMLNHSCSPNCAVQFECGVGKPGAKVGITVRAIREIRPGEQLTISYVGLAQNSSGRRRELHTQYFFSCSCPRCVASEDAHRDDPPLMKEEGGKNEWRRNREMDALKCEHAWKYEKENIVPGTTPEEEKSSPAAASSSVSSALTTRKPCPGILLSRSSHPVCSDCSLPHPLSHLQSKLKEHVVWAMGTVDGIRQELKHGAARVKVERLQEMMRLLPACVVALSQAFTPVSTLRMIALDQLLLVTVQLGAWPQAKSTAEESLEVYEFYYSKANGLALHPLLGLQYAMHAKLAWLTEDSEAALNSWLKAVDILRVTHGPEHGMVRTMEQESIPQARMEIMQRQAQRKAINAKAIKPAV
jgi:SET and MYND domain-containing protein